MDDLPEPRALEPERDALFLDFDGTLVEIGPTPDSVQVSPSLVPLLQALTTRLGGALAIRACLCNHRTEQSDLDALLGAVLRLGRERPRPVAREVPWPEAAVLAGE